MNKIIEEETLEVIQGHIRISEDRIAEENTEENIWRKITVEWEIGVDLEKGHFQETIAIIIEGMIEVQALVDQGQDQEQIWIGIELSVISVERMITLQSIVLHPMKGGK